MGEVITTGREAAPTSGPVPVAGHELATAPAVYTIRQSKILSSQRKKRIFDCTITLATAPVWAPVLAVCAILILLLEGRPVFYRSQRQVRNGQVCSILKF